MKTKKLTTLALLLALSLILSFLETLIQYPFVVPGIKIGLTNITTVYALKYFSFLECLILVLLRVFITSFLFSNLFSLIYSLSGALVSLFLMALLFKLNFSILLTSILGAISHNLAQLTAAVLVTQTPKLFISYGIILVIAGFFTGLFIGLIAKFFINHFKLTWITIKKP